MIDFVKPPLPKPKDGPQWNTYTPEDMQARDNELLRAAADWLDGLNTLDYDDPFGGPAAELRKAADK
jgi:hypothetical protein